MRLPVVSHRRPTQSGLNRSVRVTVISAAAATAAATLTGAPASADPKDTRESAKAAVDRLYGEAERATELFNEAGERVERLRGEADRAQDAAARGQLHQPDAHRRDGGRPVPHRAPSTRRSRCCSPPTRTPTWSGRPPSTGPAHARR
ncbi:hypothetical protein SMICM304S_08209 [Streptomyces microflavus]